ncbi:globin-like [Gigantopelta aegis]|uniref:globin-like n=1 Tax=Gigantopelta aegis TaxID=1735272 RepID=UPI001B88AFB2|nr:globin-like [Gigantopelta aegis]
MGSASSWFWYMLGYEDNTTPDPATGLTQYQKSLIRKSWKLLTENQKENGVAFFIALFKEYPYTQDYFEQFKGKSLEELKTSTTMRAHATTVMYSIGSLVENLDDAECLVQLCQKIGRNHFHREVSLRSFVDLQKMFGPFLKESFKKEATDDVVKAWDQLLGVLNSLLKNLATDLKYNK